MAIVLVGLEQPEFPLQYPIQRRIWVFSGCGEEEKGSAIPRPMAPSSASLLSLGSPSILSPQFLSSGKVRCHGIFEEKRENEELNLTG